MRTALGAGSPRRGIEFPHPHPSARDEDEEVGGALQGEGNHYKSECPHPAKEQK